MKIFNFKRKNQIPDSSHEKTELIGIYNITYHDDVKLVELIIEDNIDSFDLGQITQAQKGKEKLDWQTAYDEKYLNEDGKEIIGDDFDKPSGLTQFRLVFFFHFLDINKPLISQYGLIYLKQEIDLPDRLKQIIKYKTID